MLLREIPGLGNADLVASFPLGSVCAETSVTSRSARFMDVVELLLSFCVVKQNIFQYYTNENP